MRKITLAILSAFAFTALSITGAAALHAPKNVRANADLQAVQTQETELLFPSSYEEYLSLNAPSDVAVTDGYHAIADGNAVHVYDRQDGIYRTYIHEQNAESTKNVVTKLQFDDGYNLYFLDASTYLYVLDVRTLETAPAPISTGFSCSTFAIYKDALYFTNISNGISQLSKTPLTELNVSTAVTLVDKLSSKPTIAFWNGELYYTDAGVYLNKIDPETAHAAPTFISKFSSEIVSMHISGDVFTCSDILGNFYAYGLNELSSSPNANQLTPLTFEAGSHAALAAYDGFVYAVEGNAVRQYSLAELSFTSYEISAASSSLNRINGATESCLAGDKLLIADGGNSRISIYDTKSETFLEPVTSTLSASYLVSDGETVLVSDSSQAVLYSLLSADYGSTLATFDNFNGNVVGAATVYGKYYFVTDNNYFYVAENADGWKIEESKKISTKYAKLLTADAYGCLYVAGGNGVYKYTEAEFLSATDEGTLVAEDLPTATKKLLVDYEGGIYALVEGALQKLGGETYELNSPLVYSDGATVNTFAFGIEENTAYVVYAENYAVKTSLLDLPTVQTIPAQKAATDIFAAESADFSVVQTKENALVVAFDIEKLQGAENFPYLFYKRASQPFTALKIGETENYFVLAVYEESAKGYTTCLVLRSQCEEYPNDEYRTDYATPKTGYLTNAVSLYKFPYLNSLLTVSALEGGKRVDILGEIDKLDHAYYEIAYTDESGTTHTGYVPKVYVSHFNAAPPASQETVVGSTEDNRDGIWRLVYLLLGTGAICILVDYLILKKRDKED